MHDRGTWVIKTARDIGNTFTLFPICGPVWRRCLVMIDAGDVDVISSIAKSPERERYLQFIEPPYRTGYDIYFYTRGTDLGKYEDLQGLRIGHIRGSAYF